APSASLSANTPFVQSAKAQRLNNRRQGSLPFDNLIEPLRSPGSGGCRHPNLLPGGGGRTQAFAAWFRRARHYRRASSYRSANELQMRARPSSADGVTSSDTLQAIAVYLDRHLAALKTDADGDLPRSRRDRAQRSGSSTSAHHSTAPSRQEGPQRQGKV